MLHVRSVSTGVAGSPYYTNLYFNASASDVATVLGRVRNFWVALAPQMRSALITNVESEVREIDPVTGNVISIQTGPEQTPVAGGNVGTVAPPANQGLIRLTTSGVRRNRRVRGRIFIPGVPSAAINASGQANGPYQTALTDAATALRATTGGVQLVVWSRPIEITGPVVVPGQQSPVIGASAWQEFAVLRSRRD